MTRLIYRRELDTGNPDRRRTGKPNLDLSEETRSHDPLQRLVREHQSVSHLSWTSPLLTSRRLATYDSTGVVDYTDIFNEAGDKLVASVKGTPPADPGFLAVWDVSQDGTLSADFTKIGAPTGGLLPFSMTNINGRNAILATDAGVGFDIFDFSTVKNTQTKADQT